MMQSMSSLNAALISFSSLKTISSVQTRLEGRANVLKSELKIGGGNEEAKREELSEQQEKISKVTDQLNQGLGKLNEELSKPLTPEEKAEILEAEKAEKEKEAQKLEEKQSADDDALNADSGDRTTQAPSMDKFVPSGAAFHRTAAVSVPAEGTGEAYSADRTISLSSVVGENLSVFA